MKQSFAVVLVFGLSCLAMGSPSGRSSYDKAKASINIRLMGIDMQTGVEPEPLGLREDQRKAAAKNHMNKFKTGEISKQSSSIRSGRAYSGKGK